MLNCVPEKKKKTGSGPRFEISYLCGSRDMIYSL